MYQYSALVFFLAASSCACAIVAPAENFVWLCALAVVLALAGLALCLDAMLSHATNVIAYEIRDAKREIGRVADLTRQLADANWNAVILRRQHVELLETMLKTKGTE